MLNIFIDIQQQMFVEKHPVGQSIYGTCVLIEVVFICDISSDAGNDLVNRCELIISPTEPLQDVFLVYGHSAYSLPNNPRQQQKAPSL